AAFRLAMRAYLRELAGHRLLAVGALLLPALGNIGIFYLPPLVVADLVTDLAAGSTGSAGLTVVLVMAAMLGGEALFRAGIHCLNRVDASGIESLYVQGMDALLAKDAAFFHENFAGSLTKRVLSYASQFEGFVDTLAFNVVSKLLPLAFA